MELVTTEEKPSAFNNVVNMPVVRQISLVIGLALSIAVGVFTVFWMQDKDYAVLHNNLNGQVLGDVTGVLDRNGIKYKIDADSGSVLVESSSLNDAKLKLASENIPIQLGQGFELLDKETGFGTSNFLQVVRYQRALEGELSRTITSLKPVQDARVHLAIPKESAFLRENRKPSASVMVRLYPGQQLDKNQINAITNLVASGIPSLSKSQVTVVDDKGNLLNNSDADEGIELTTTQYEYKKKLENDYIKRIENILIPIVGMDKIRAQVNADVDFTFNEQTSETYNPDLPALRSERSEEELNRGLAATGIPGALSNQPPVNPSAPQQANNQAQQEQQTPTNSSKRNTRNYELDRTISHRKNSTGSVKRLSVAVALDFKPVFDAAGKVTKVPFDQAEIDNLTNLVKQAVGFVGLRGDSVKLLNIQFSAPEAIEPLPELPLWEQDWVRYIAKNVLGFVVLLVIVLGVIRPLLRGVTAKPAEEEQAEAELADDQLSLSGAGPQGLLASPSSYEENLEKARSLASQEPVLVAQVVKSWMAEEAGK